MSVHSGEPMRNFIENRSVYSEIKTENIFGAERVHLFTCINLMPRSNNVTIVQVSYVFHCFVKL
jgi:hypothetical protein